MNAAVRVCHDQSYAGEIVSELNVYAVDFDAISLCSHKAQRQWLASRRHRKVQFELSRFQSREEKRSIRLDRGSNHRRRSHRIGFDKSDEHHLRYSRQQVLARWSFNNHKPRNAGRFGDPNLNIQIGVSNFEVRRLAIVIRRLRLVFSEHTFRARNANRVFTGWKLWQ